MTLDIYAKNITQVRRILLNPAKLLSLVDNVKCNTNEHFFSQQVMLVAMRDTNSKAKKMASNITKIPFTKAINLKIPSNCSASSLSQD